MLFWTNFVSLPLVTHFHTSRDPPKVRHTSQTPQFLVVHAYIHMSLHGVCLSLWCFMSGRFCPGWFLSISLLSEYIRYDIKLNITLHFRFYMYENILKA